MLGAKRKDIERAVKEFKPLSHRFQKVRELKGIEFIDDSKSTNVDSARRAIESIDKPIVLIAGGKDKNISYKKILPSLKKNVKKVVLIGEVKDKMEKIFKKFTSLAKEDTLPEAVKEAYKSASSGDVVLLSPMCSSFDMFENYKERGKVFQEAVKTL